jgi:hypothetical protein
VLQEFRSLALFALRQYKEAAAAIHTVLAVGPGWDFKTLSGLYGDVDTYTAHLRALEAVRNKNLDAAELRFLVGYHYLACGFPDDALIEFREAARLVPKDTVTAALVATLSPDDSLAEDSEADITPPAVAPDELVGTWTAAGQEAEKFHMDLRNDGTFSWSFSHGAANEEVQGVYSLEGNVLAMEPDSGGVLLAELTSKGKDDLKFQMIGALADDPGLHFQRAPAK